jgi:hypothetical protein
MMESTTTCNGDLPLTQVRSPARSSSTSLPRSRSRTPSPNAQRTTEHSIFLNRKTTLKTLYRYPLGAVVEYPETSVEGSVGHLFEVSLDDWSNPRMNFVYSQGEPSGRTKRGSTIWCELLVDSDGTKVPCQEVHSTCMYEYCNKCDSPTLIIHQVKAAKSAPI